MMLTHEQQNQILNDLESAWRDIHKGIRKIARVYKCDYDTLFNAVCTAVNEHVDIDNITKD